MLDSILNMALSQNLHEITTDVGERLHTYPGLTLTAGTCPANPAIGGAAPPGQDFRAPGERQAAAAGLYSVVMMMMLYRPASAPAVGFGAEMFLNREIYASRRAKTPEWGILAGFCLILGVRQAALCVPSARLSAGSGRAWRYLCFPPFPLYSFNLQSSIDIRHSSFINASSPRQRHPDHRLPRL